MSESIGIGSEVLRFSSSVYHLDTIKKAAYRFLDRFSTDFQLEGDEIICSITFTNPIAADGIKRLLSEFRKEVLDQDLRRSIAVETTQLRNAILALAFASSKLQGSE